MVFVKVRETYDLHTVKNKMTVIAIHTPKPDILKKTYPGLLLQCKAYRPVSADVRMACASVLPLDPRGVGLTEDDVAPEDMFNPILYKAMSNFGMSQLEARISQMGILENTTSSADIAGSTANVDIDTFTPEADEFNVYYGLLANTHEWKHAHPQSGLQMNGLEPLVWDMVYNVGDNLGSSETKNEYFAFPDADGYVSSSPALAIRGGPKKMPFINTTAYSHTAVFGAGDEPVGFKDVPWNSSINVPYFRVCVGAIIAPPSRLHEFYYRLVVEWTLEFSKIRPLSDIVSVNAVGTIGSSTHYQNYSYEVTKKVITGDPDSMLDSDSCMVSANVDIEKVM